jgi:hypothetical protein
MRTHSKVRSHPNLCYRISAADRDVALGVDSSHCAP